MRTTCPSCRAKLEFRSLLGIRVFRMVAGRRVYDVRCPACGPVDVSDADLRRPTRGDLLRVLGRLQGLIGDATAFIHDDRNPDAHAKVVSSLKGAHALCIQALSADPPEASEPTGRGWGDDADDHGSRHAR